MSQSDRRPSVRTHGQSGRPHRRPSRPPPREAASALRGLTRKEGQAVTSEDICHPSESRAGHRSATSHLRLARWTTGLGTPFRVRTWPTTLETAAARCSPRPAGLRRFWDTAISATPPSVSPPVRQCSGYLCGKWIFGKVSAFGGPDNDIHVDVVTRQCPVLCPAGHGLVALGLRLSLCQ